MGYVTICVSEETRDRLKELKIFRRESLDAVICRYIGEAIKPEEPPKVKVEEPEEETWQDPETGEVWDTKTGQLITKKEETAEEEIKKYSEEGKE